MTLNFYTLSVIYLVYSFLGWVAETVAATIRGGRFANRGAAAGPFCFIYGTTGVLLAVSFGDLRTEPVYLFFACMMAATVMEWITAKLLERLHRRKWWDYSGKKFNLNGYVCLQYSLLWGELGTASVLWGNDVLLRLCAHIPVWLLRPAVWISLTVAVLDQIGSAVLVQQYAARHPVLEQLNQRLGKRSDTLRRRIALYIEKRIQYAYPAAARQEQTALRKGEKNFTIIDKSTKRIGTVGINPSDFPFNFYLFICCPDDRYQCVHHLPLVLKADILPVIQIPGNAFHLLHRHSVRREFCNLIGNGLPPCVQLLNFAVGIGEQNRACARQRVKQLFNLAFHLRQFQPLCSQFRGDFCSLVPACQRLKIF